MYFFNPSLCCRTTPAEEAAHAERSEVKIPNEFFVHLYLFFNLKIQRPNKGILSETHHWNKKKMLVRSTHNIEEINP